MKRLITATILLLSSLVAGTLAFGFETDGTASLDSQPLAFIENLGQWEASAVFRAEARGAIMWFTADGVYYQSARRIPQDPLQGDGDAESFGFDHGSDKIEIRTIKASFVGANRNPGMSGQTTLDYKCNYLFGNDPTRWYTDVPSYEAVIYGEIYPGIDLKYYGNGKELEYDFVVSPGADPSQIRVRYEGVETISINDNGDLVVTTEWGEVVERRPHVYQLKYGREVAIDTRYGLFAENTFGFSIHGEYDPALPLIIDPTLSYSTYLGASSFDRAHDVAVDSYGAAYVVGYTYSTNFPTLNPYQTDRLTWDAFVTKLSAAGNSLVYSTYLGGDGVDYGNGIAVDADGAAYVTGWTSSSDFPAVNAIQGVRGGGENDAFVAKLSVNGNSLHYSTYLGGTDWDRAYRIAVNGAGEAYVVGETKSAGFPTLNPYQTYQGDMDAFVARLSSSGTSLLYSTYLGGGGADYGRAIAVAASGVAYLTGLTRSADFPTLNPIQTYQGLNDVFVTALTDEGDGLVFSTFLGGWHNDGGVGIAVDASGALCVTGTTASVDFPTFNAYQATYQGGQSDVFVTKLGSSGDFLVYSTFLGSSANDLCSGLAMDAWGAAYVTGATYGSDFPVVDPFQTYQGAEGITDAYVTKLSSDGSGLDFSTFLGGSSWDHAFGLALDPEDAIYVTGETASTDFPLLGPFQTNQLDTDAFVTKMYEHCCRIVGDINHDGLVDILDFQYLRDYLHKDGPEPLCRAEADVNGDGQITQDDIACLARFLFSSGNPCVFVDCP